jgi:microcystin-dependent protein
MRSLFAALFLLCSPLAHAQGVINIALTQQVNANGIPLAGALLYVFQVGTVATPQNTFQDFGLTIPNPWPLQADSTGRIPMFYLANGQVHVRLTDATGVVIFDYPTMQVVGPSSGGGGGGGASVDPTTILSTGDIKFRATTEAVTGWVKVNGQTIGSAGSGASGRAAADTQNLFVYLWNSCPNTHCPVSGGRGSSALTDFNSNKQITLLDWRGRTPVGLDDMGTTAAGRIAITNVTSGGGDTQTTPGATGGEANHALIVAELAAHSHTITDPGHSHDVHYQQTNNNPGGGVAGVVASIAATGLNTTVQTATNTTGITIASTGSGTAHNTMMPFMLGTWYIKL